MGDAVQAGESARSAMAGWGELVPLVIFLIIGAVINARKKKEQDKALRNESNPKSPSPSGARPGAAIPVPTAKDYDDGEDEEEWEGESREGEHSERWDDHKRPDRGPAEVRSGENRNVSLTSGPNAKDNRRSIQTEAQRNIPGDRKPPQPLVSDKAREKAVDIGKDLLGQLAKELGLELPTGKPTPRPQPPPPSPAPTPAREATRRPVSPAHTPRSYNSSPDEARARAVEASRSRPHAPLGAGNAAPGVPDAASKALQAARDLSDPEALRRAFILKTILDKPVSMRPKGNRD